MAIFGSDPVAGASSAIPPGFPLDKGQVAMTGDGGEKIGPSPDAPGLGRVTLRGQDVWPVSPNARLASVATGPEYSDRREDVTFAV